MDVLKTINIDLPPLPFSVEVALSGGLDSVCLLHVLHRLSAVHFFSLSAVHVHHGLQLPADNFADFCEKLCAAWHIPLRVERVAVPQQNNIEARARAARYRAFAASSADIIALAHHADDQAETVMLNVLRGGGAAALSGMPIWRDFAENKRIWRPFLAFSRQDLEAYAREQRLDFCQDPMNFDAHFRRSFLRNELFPKLQTAYPHYRQQLLRSAQTAQDERQILADLDAEFLANLAGLKTRFCLPWSFLQCGEALRRRRLWLWLRALFADAPSPAALADFSRQLADFPQQKARLHWRQFEIFAAQHGVGAWRFVRDFPAVNIAFSPKFAPFSQPIAADFGVLRWLWGAGGLDLAKLAARVVRLAPAALGATLDTGARRVAVKTLLREAGVAAPFRAVFPAIFCDAELIALPNIAIAASWRASAGVLPLWQDYPAALHFRRHSPHFADVLAKSPPIQDV